MPDPDSDESWEPTESLNDYLDLGLCGYDAEESYSKAENLDIAHCSSNNDTTTTLTSNAISSGDGGNHHLTASSHKYTTSLCVEFPGNKKRKQGMHGNQASQTTVDFYELSSPSFVSV